MNLMLYSALGNITLEKSALILAMVLIIVLALRNISNESREPPDY